MVHLLSQLTKKKVFNFRKNDIFNGGEGAPLTPIFHKYLIKSKKIKLTSLYFKYWRYFKLNFIT